MTKHDDTTKTTVAELSLLRSLLTAPDAAGLLGVTVKTLETWRGTGNGPAYIKLSGKYVRYSHEDLDAFVQAHRRHNTSEAV